MKQAVKISMHARVILYSQLTCFRSSSISFVCNFNCSKASDIRLDTLSTTTASDSAFSVASLISLYSAFNFSSCSSIFLIASSSCDYLDFCFSNSPKSKFRLLLIFRFLNLASSTFITCSFGIIESIENLEISAFM